QAVKRAIRRAKIRVPQRSVMGFTMKKNGSDKKHPFCISLLANFTAWTQSSKAGLNNEVSPCLLTGRIYALSA
ncbi:MAG: hypothetical protein ABR955_08595, partial [Verrucomicrobiota bacterium]